MRITYSAVTSTLALAVALSTGGAYAADRLLPSNSVTTKTIANGQVKTNDIGRSAVTSRKVARSSLRGIDINELTLSKVPAAGTSDRAMSARRADEAVHAEVAERSMTVDDA